MDILEKFVVFGTGNKNGDSDGTSTLPRSIDNTTSLKYCKDFQKAAGDDYVLYNVVCAMGSDSSSPMLPHQFYRTKEWLERKTHSSLNASLNQ